MESGYDALLVVSFGGPEKPEDVMPFLENVTRGRGIPKERLLEVAEHYHHFGGRSPINDQNRELIAALEERLRKTGLNLPVYWGNRNWNPFLADTMREMKSKGVRRAAAYITSIFGSYSGCRQYRDDIDRARAETGEGAPEIVPMPLFFDRQGFLGPMAERIAEALSQFDAPPHLVFTAHSVPMSMAESSPYVSQLRSACASISEQLKHPDWTLVYQSRSGPPSQPWLEPDILEHIRELHAAGKRDLVIAPIGFISDHMEVLYDLDTEARDLCGELGMRMVRAGTVGTHPGFVQMIVDHIGSQRCCAPDCCPGPRRSANVSDRPAAGTGPAEN